MTLWTVQVLFPCLDEVVTTDNDDPLPSETMLVKTETSDTINTKTLDISSPGAKPSFTKRTRPRAGRNTPNRLWRKLLSLQFLLKCWLNHDQGVGMVSQGATIAGSMTTMRFNRLKCLRKSHLSGCSEKGLFYFKLFLLLATTTKGISTSKCQWLLGLQDYWSWSA